MLVDHALKVLKQIQDVLHAYVKVINIYLIMINLYVLNAHNSLHQMLMDLILYASQDIRNKENNVLILAQKVHLLMV